MTSNFFFVAVYEITSFSLVPMQCNILSHHIISYVTVPSQP
jgi:hypothetical protein